jgi:hypothetical protein
MSTGMIVANANGVGSVGVAPNAKFSAIRVVGLDPTQFMAAFQFNSGNIYIIMLYYYEQGVETKHTATNVIKHNSWGNPDFVPFSEPDETELPHKMSAN